MKTIGLKTKNSPQIVQETAEIIKQGGIIIYPTDTCYGLGGNFEDQKVVEKINQIKNRANDKKFSVIVKDFAMIKKYCDLNQEQEKIMKQYLPGPYTFVLKLIKYEETLGIRIPKYPLTQKLADELQIPYITTSANLSGHEPCYDICCLKTQLCSNLDKIDLIIDAGDLPKNPPSKVVDLTSGKLKVLRR